jgi:uncharacterized membrane protein SirB2
MLIIEIAIGVALGIAIGIAIIPYVIPVGPWLLKGVATVIAYVAAACAVCSHRETAPEEWRVY